MRAFIAMLRAWWRDDDRRLADARCAQRAAQWPRSFAVGNWVSYPLGDAEGVTVERE